MRPEGHEPANRRDLWGWLARSAAHMRGDLPLVFLDAVVVVSTYLLLFVTRFNFEVPDRYWHRFWLFAPIGVAMHLLATWAWGGYGRTWEHASVDEARRLLAADVTSALVLMPIFSRGDPNVPLLVLLTGPVVVLLLQGAIRFQSRLFAFRRGASADGGLRVAVVGAGATGAAAVREMRRSPHVGLHPVVVVDDDDRVQGRSLLGVPVVGDVDHLSDVVRRFDVHQVLLAVPSGGPVLARRVAEGVEGSGAVVRVLPRSTDWLHGKGSLRDVRDLRIEDLLGRDEVDLDLAPVRALILGRSVLVTGAGGSIGSEIARQVSALSPGLLVLLDHDETHLHDAVADLPGRVEAVLADVRDPVVVADVFATARPDVVFHAAAHKHVPILERYACEAFRTNVLGTLHVVEAARRNGTAHLVYISTDKVANPTSVMGASKWLAEQVVLAHVPEAGGYSAVRFGNVLGSRGSVIPTFQRQIAAGGPVTVTDPRMTRWFMSTDEAVRLVLQAAAESTGHPVVALQMGEQVNILELAERMIRLCGREPGVDVQVLVTGRRPGEKLVETLVGPGERIDGVGAAPIFGITTRRLEPGTLDDAVARLTVLADELDHAGARRALLEIAAPDGRALGVPGRWAAARAPERPRA